MWCSTRPARPAPCCITVVNKFHSKSIWTSCEQKTKSQMVRRQYGKHLREICSQDHGTLPHVYASRPAPLSTWRNMRPELFGAVAHGTCQSTSEFCLFTHISLAHGTAQQRQRPHVPQTSIVTCSCPAVSSSVALVPCGSRPASCIRWGCAALGAVLRNAVALPLLRTKFICLLAVDGKLKSSVSSSMSNCSSRDPSERALCMSPLSSPNVQKHASF